MAPARSRSAPPASARRRGQVPPGLAGLLDSSTPAGSDRDTERRLLGAARRGDRAATEALLRRLSGTVFRFGQSFCRDPDDAQDLMQDVLRSLLVTLPSFRGDSSLSTWAFTVARRACARRRQRMARMTSLENSEAPADRPDPAAGPDEQAERRDLSRAIRRAIADLPAAHREVVMLRDVEGLPASEVAKVLGIGERAVKSRLHRARLALREALSPYADGAPRTAHQTGRPAAAPPAPGCPDTARMLSRYLEGELDSGVCDRLASHVASCPSCGEACDTLRAVLGACRAWGAKPLPAEEQARVRAAIRGVLNG